MAEYKVPIGQVRYASTNRPFQQIDGVIELDGEIYLVEMKWLKAKVGKGDVSEHLVHIFNRNCTRGIFISASEFTKPALTVCKESLSKLTFFLCTLDEIVRLLEREGDLRLFFKHKLQAAIIDKKPYYKILE